MSVTSFKGVRSSKFRNVYGNPSKREECYDCIKITKNAHDTYCCAVNPKFLAVVTETAGGGSFVVIPIEQTGRQRPDTAKVTGHRGPVLDLKWNPFNDNIIASCSDDCSIKLWYIPDDGLRLNLTEAIIELNGHKRRVGYLEWHPTAENVLFSAGFDFQILVWDVSDGKLMRTIDCHPDMIHSMSFNKDGSLLATTCKDKKIRIINPRDGKVIKEGNCHKGPRASKVAYLGDTGLLFTTGIAEGSREYAIWSQNELSSALKRDIIDSSSGILFPYFDQDTRMVYLAGKGDGNIRYYEIVDDPPYCHYLSQFCSSSPQRSLGVMPKRGLDVMRCEIFRFYKLHTVKQLCEPISMIAPRKSEHFQEDLFPDTDAPTPALSCEEWFNGKNRNPILISLKNCTNIRTNKPEPQKLTTADTNNEQNFVINSQDNKVDCRNYANGNGTVHENGHETNNNAKNSDNQKISKVKTSIFWQSENVKKRHPLPDVATIVTIEDAEETPNDTEMNTKSLQTKNDKLKRACKRQQSEIVSLKKQLGTKEKRIKELEGQLQRLVTNGSQV